MSLSGFAVRRPWSITVFNIGLMLIGLFCFSKLPVSLFPQVRLPFVSVRVLFPGAEASDIEQKVAVRLEQEFNKIGGLSRLISFVRPNGAQFILGFRFGSSESAALLGIRQALDRSVAMMPEGVKPAEIRNIDANQTPVLIYGINRSLNQLERDTLLAELGKAKEISSAELLGQGNEQLQIVLDPNALSALQIAPLEVYESVKGNIAAVPWGNFKGSDGSEVPVRGEASSNAFRWLNLRDGRSVEISEIAKVKMQREENSPRVYVDGKPAVSLLIYKKLEVGTPQAVAAAERMVKSYADRHDLRFEKIIDQSIYITENAKEVWIALFWGGFFAIVTVLVFLRDLRSGLITGTALPVSICASFVGLAFFGFSLNMLTLLALSLAIGLLIDDAVVVREAIFKELERGLEPKRAAIEGTRKVFSAVVATTLCIIAVFLPVSLTGGLIGQFFKEFGITICVAVSVSAWVAFTLDPMLSAYFTKSGTATLTHANSPRAKPFKNWVRRLLKRALFCADWAYRHNRFTVAVAVSLFVLSILFANRNGVDFMAREDKSQFLVEYINEAGKSPSHLDAMAQAIVQAAHGIPGIKSVVSEIASGPDSSRGLTRVVLNPKASRSQSESLAAIEDQLRARLRASGMQFLVKDPPPIEGVGGEAPLSLYLYGDDLEKMHEQAKIIQARLESVPGTGSVSIDSQGLSRAVSLQIDSAQAAQLGIDMARIHGTGRLALAGLSAGLASPPNEKSQQLLDVFVTIDEKFRNPDELLEKVLVPSNDGRYSLARFVTYQSKMSPQAIDRENDSRKVVIYGSPDGSVSFGRVLADWQTIADQVASPFRAELGGDRDIFSEMLGNFSFAIVGGLLFIFILLVFLYENLWMPLLVLCSLPLAAIGGFIALGMSGERLAMGSMIGFVLLIGISAKNGILLVDAAAQVQRRFGLRLAILYAVKSRMRPILMTSFALFVGMLPTVFLNGSGAEFRQPMAIAILGGIVSSTVLSLLLMPAFFGLMAAFFSLVSLKPPTDQSARPRQAWLLRVLKRLGIQVLVYLALAQSVSTDLWAQSAFASKKNTAIAFDYFDLAASDHKEGAFSGAKALASHGAQNSAGLASKDDGQSFANSASLGGAFEDERGASSLGILRSELGLSRSIAGQDLNLQGKIEWEFPIYDPFRNELRRYGEHIRRSASTLQEVQMSFSSIENLGVRKIGFERLRLLIQLYGNCIEQDLLKRQMEFRKESFDSKAQTAILDSNQERDLLLDFDRISFLTQQEFELLAALAELTERSHAVNAELFAFGGEIPQSCSVHSKSEGQPLRYAEKARLLNLGKILSLCQGDAGQQGEQGDALKAEFHQEDFFKVTPQEFSRQIEAWFGTLGAAVPTEGLRSSEWSSELLREQALVVQAKGKARFLGFTQFGVKQPLEEKGLDPQLEGQNRTEGPISFSLGMRMEMGANDSEIFEHLNRLTGTMAKNSQPEQSGGAVLPAAALQSQLGLSKTTATYQRLFDSAPPLIEQNQNLQQLLKKMRAAAAAGYATRFSVFQLERRKAMLESQVLRALTGLAELQLLAAQRNNKSLMAFPCSARGVPTR